MKWLCEPNDPFPYDYYLETDDKTKFAFFTDSLGPRIGGTYELYIVGANDVEESVGHIPAKDLKKYLDKVEEAFCTTDLNEVWMGT